MPMAEKTMSVPSLLLYVRAVFISLYNQRGDARGEDALNRGAPTAAPIVGEEIYDILGSQPNAKGADVTCPER